MNTITQAQLHDLRIAALAWDGILSPADVSFICGMPHAARERLLTVFEQGGLQGGADDDAGDDDSGGAGDGDDTNAGDGGGDSGDKDRNDAAAKLQQQLDTTREKLQRLEKEKRDNKAKADAAADRKRAKDEGAQKVLDEKLTELQKANERIAELEAESTARVETTLASLPDSVQSLLKDARETMSPSAWAKLVEGQADLYAKDDNAGDDDDEAGGDDVKNKRLPPPTGSPRRPKGKPGESYTPSAQATDMLDDMLVGDEMLRKLEVVKGSPDSGGNPKFTMPVKKMIKEVKKFTPQTISFQSEVNRRG